MSPQSLIIRGPQSKPRAIPIDAQPGHLLAQMERFRHCAADERHLTTIPPHSVNPERALVSIATELAIEPAFSPIWEVAGLSSQWFVLAVCAL